MRLEVVHHTTLTYDQPIAETHMEVRLRPLDGAGQVVESFELAVAPSAEVRSFRDGFGNVAHYFNQVAVHSQVDVTGQSFVRTRAGVPALDDTLFPDDFLQFRDPVLDVPGVRELAARFRQGSVEVRLDALAAHINERFEYRPQTTQVSTTVEEVLRRRVGVCQDFAHLFVAAARAMGIPTRYVSGYIHAGIGYQGTGASHAWAEALVPDQGWVGYDPTNPIRTSEYHVRVAVGRDYQDVAPTRGTYVGSAVERMEVQVTTRVLTEAPS